MKFVDEFRDPHLIRQALDEIRGLLEPGRHYRIMEVCGHAIYRFGLEDLLPTAIELIHGPGCPVCVLPMGRVDDGLSVLSRADVIFTTFGDVLRVPGRHGSPLEHRARGADVRMVYSPLDALKIAIDTPDRQVMFFAIGFETTAPSTALTLRQAKARDVRNFSVFCNHVTIVPAIRAILDSPDMRLDAFISPGHVSTVIGCQPFTFVPKDHGKPLVVGGFEPLDLLQAIVMILRQLRAGTAKVENQYDRVVPWEGNGPALKAMAEVFELRPYFEWRGLGFIPQSALQLREAYAPWDAERRFDVPAVRVTDPDAAQCGEVLKGVLRPEQCKPFGRERTPERPVGPLMVSSEGACEAHTTTPREEVSMPGPDAAAPVQGVRVPAPADAERVGLSDPRIRFADPQIEISHGAGGKASRRLIEGLFAPLFNGSLAPMSDAAVLDVDGARLAFTADSFVVRPLRFPGGSIGDLAINGTVNDLAVSGARPMALLVTFVLEAGLSGEVLAQEARAIGDAAARSGVAIVGGDTKVVEHGKADGLYVTTAGIGRVDARVVCSPASVRAGDRILVSGPIGDHGVTVLLARGEIDLDADIRSDTRPLWPFVERLIERAGPGIRWMRDPTRGGVATALNELARDTGLGMTLFESAVPVRDPVRGACELLGLDPLYIACEGQLLAVVAEQHADAALEALRSLPGGEDAAVVGEVRTAPERTLVSISPYGGTRVVDMLVGDPLPGIC